VHLLCGRELFNLGFISQGVQGQSRLNGQGLAGRFGQFHNYSFNALEVPLALLKSGRNGVDLFSTFKGHTIEINWPGPLLLLELAPVGRQPPLQSNPMTADGIPFQDLQARARKLRMLIVRMIAMAGSGHCGGSLSAIDILTYLYFYELRVRPEAPLWAERDRFVLSKGHCAPALYAVLAERGFFPEEKLWTLRDINSTLQGHPDMRKTPGIDITSGSLGQGFSCAVGMALAGKMDHQDYRVYVMLGDSEVQTGLLWEAAMFSRHQGLDNLIAVIDNNQLQSDGVTKTIVDIEPLAEKWRGFGWEPRRIDGHDFHQIHAAFAESKSLNGQPKVVIADTVKGKGVSFMENVVSWHSGAPDSAQTQAALRELAGDL